MLIRIAVPEAQVNEAVLNPALEAVTSLNEQLIKQGLSPTFHQALKGGVRWKPEPKDGYESFDNGTLVSQRNWGDCDDLAPLRAASLRSTGEDPYAQAIVYRSGPKRWHAVVQRGDGNIEDPSEMAGMRAAQAYVGSAAPIIARMPRSAVLGVCVGSVLGFDAYGEYDDSGLWYPGGEDPLYDGSDYDGGGYDGGGYDYGDDGGYDYDGGYGDDGGGYGGGDGGYPAPPSPAPPTGSAPSALQARPGAPTGQSGRPMGVRPAAPGGQGPAAPGAPGAPAYHGPIPTRLTAPTGRAPKAKPYANPFAQAMAMAPQPQAWAPHQVHGVQPVVALRPLYSTKSGAVVGWEARTDMPWEDTQRDLTVLRRAGLASQALVGSVLGACMLGQASGTADPRNLQRCMGIVGLLRGSDPAELADRIGPRAVVGAAQFLRDVAGTVAQHGGSGVGIDFGDVFHAIEPVLSKAVSFVPGVGPIAATALDVTQQVTQKHGGASAAQAAPACWCVDPKTGTIFAKA